VGCQTSAGKTVVFTVESRARLALCKDFYNQTMDEKCVPIQSGFWQYGFNATYTPTYTRMMVNIPAGQFNGLESGCRFQLSIVKKGSGLFSNQFPACPADC